MRKTGSDRFSAMREQVLTAEPDLVQEETAEAPLPTRRSGILAARQSAVADITSGRIRSVRVLMHPPGRIRAWSGHNRDYDRLSEIRCADLIDSFRRASQQLPVIVREVAGSPDFDYEFICGARRHWTATYLERDLMVEVRSLSDKEAFELQDIENRDREDVSAYERAKDYKRALSAYYGGNKKRMAEALKIDRPNFSRFLTLAELPETIIQALADERELLPHHGTIYHQLLENRATAERVKESLKALGDNKLSGKALLARLRSCAADSESAGSPSAADVVKRGALSARRNRSGRCTITFAFPSSTATDESTLKALQADFNAVLSDMAKGASDVVKGGEP